MTPHQEVYEFCVRNIVSYIKRQSKKIDSPDWEGLNAFVFSSTLAVAFCKSQEDVMVDILRQTEGLEGLGSLVKHP